MAQGLQENISTTKKKCLIFYLWFNTSYLLRIVAYHTLVIEYVFTLPNLKFKQSSDII